MEHKKNTKSFASRWGFILASVGSAVGMANVWGFPNKMGSNGGGAFLLIYLLFVFIFSYVGLPAEFAMGRRAATGTLGAYENAWDTRSKSAGKVGGLLGWLPLAGSLCIAIGYAVIVTYVLKALVDSLLGTLLTTDTAAWFGVFSSTPYSVIPYHIVVVVGTLLTLFLGARSIEKTNKVMMPVFFVIFLILAVRVALLPGAAEGYVFMFTPRWEALTNPMIWIWAMGQAFFSLSVTGYPGWPGDRANPLAAVLGRVWREQTGRTLELSAVHVGLEPSVFRAKAPGLVMASAGPDILDAHSVDERAPLDGLPDYALLLAGAMEAL